MYNVKGRGSSSVSGDGVKRSDVIGEQCVY